ARLRRLLAEQIPAGMGNGGDEDKGEGGSVQSAAPACIRPSPGAVPAAGRRPSAAVRPFILPTQRSSSPAVHHACPPAGTPAGPGQAERAMSDPPVVHLLRHGEVSNPRGVLYGRLPGYHLSEEGRLMAKAAAGFLAGRDVTVLRSSPLERALETAAPLAAQF